MHLEARSNSASLDVLIYNLVLAYSPRAQNNTLHSSLSLLQGGCELINYRSGHDVHQISLIYSTSSVRNSDNLAQTCKHNSKRSRPNTSRTTDNDSLLRRFFPIELCSADVKSSVGYDAAFFPVVRKRRTHIFDLSRFNFDK